MKYVQIVSSRPLGERCQEIAKELLPSDWQLIDNLKSPHNPGDEGVIISVLFADIIKEFRPGVRYYNFHPGILPEYAGSATLSWSIINGEREAGCTLHELTDEVDAGDIIEIRKFPITETDTSGDLGRKFTETCEWMFRDWFPKLLEPAKYDATKYHQNRENRHYYKRNDLEKVKDLTHIVRALTFPGKESAFFLTKEGKRIELDYFNGAKVKSV